MSILGRKNWEKAPRDTIGGDGSLDGRRGREGGTYHLIGGRFKQLSQTGGAFIGELIA